MKMQLLQLILQIFLISSENSWHKSYEDLHQDSTQEDIGIISTCVDLCVADDYAVRSNVVSTSAFTPFPFDN